ncbi:MAG: hypothetical protein RL387_1072 [Bacteroidota bacterium]|jgi:putative SOS response-associated peptidase YedK
MCYVIGVKVPKKQTIKIGDTPLEIDPIEIPVQSGFAYTNWPVIYKEQGQLRPGPMHWELIPSWTRNQKDLVESRKKYTTLNIKSEGIFTNKVAQAVVHTNRCLVLASHFFEWQEIEKQKYPHCIQIDNTPLFYIAGVWNNWTDYSTGESKNSFGIITTEANSLMSKIHNVKKRMPTILDDEKANAWVNEHLTEKQIQEIASYQFPAEKMKSHTVAKNFQQAEDPTAPTNFAIFTPQTLF